eukprot:813240-Prymnesium_polylepis.1
MARRVRTSMMHSRATLRPVMSPQSWQRASSLSKYLEYAGPLHSSHRGPRRLARPGLRGGVRVTPPPVRKRDGRLCRIVLAAETSLGVAPLALFGARGAEWPIEASLAIGARLTSLQAGGRRDTLGTERGATKPTLPAGRASRAWLRYNRPSVAVKPKRANLRLARIVDCRLVAPRPRGERRRDNGASGAKVTWWAGQHKKGTRVHLFANRAGAATCFTPGSNIDSAYHVRQAERPATPWYEPFGHCSHAAAPSSENVPSGHRVSWLLPGGQACPAEQSRHCSLRSSFSSSPTVPAGHKTSDGEPRRQ